MHHGGALGYKNAFYSEVSAFARELVKSFVVFAGVGIGQLDEGDDAATFGELSQKLFRVVGLPIQASIWPRLKGEANRADSTGANRPSGGLAKECLSASGHAADGDMLD
jgi:hypothetical protein